MIRREFIKSGAVVSATSVLGVNCSSAKSNDDMSQNSKYKLGYQLFSVNEDMKQDPLGTLTKMKVMGYQDFEIYGFDPEKLTYYGIDATDFKKRLNDMDLTVTSGHYGFTDYLAKSNSDLKWYVDKCIQGAKALNSPYITWPWLAPAYRNIEGYKLMVSKLNPIGQQVSDAGLTFAYHNHGFEFDDHDGVNAYDMIMNETDPALVKLQLDMYWVMHAGTTTPKELINKQPGRFVMWHIKDMDAITRDYSELGNGAINYVNVLPDPKTSGLVYYYIEQGGNFAHSALKSAEDSAVYLKQNLQHLL